MLYGIRIPRGKIALIMGIMLLVVVDASEAQTQLQVDTFTAGGGTSSSSNYTLQGSVGQVMTNTATSSSSAVSEGLWPGIYLKGETTAISPDESKREIPEEFSLDPAYPNPFNPSTNISYSLPEAADVRLTVYNMLGRHVKELVNEQQNAGRHEVTFQADALSSGTYIYRIEAGSFTKVRKMTLLK